MRIISPYEKLGQAIIVQACKDYRYALRTNNVRYIREIETFFLSGWYLLLTRIDGKDIMNRLRKEYQDENNKALPRHRNPSKG